MKVRTDKDGAASTPLHISEAENKRILTPGIYIDSNNKKAIYISNQPQIKQLAFQGGGVKEMAMEGVIEALEQSYILPHVSSVIGTSSGSMTALFLALGYNAKKIAEIDKNNPLSNLVESIPKNGMKEEIFFNWLTPGKHITDNSLDPGTKLTDAINEVIAFKLMEILHNHPELNSDTAFNHLVDTPPEKLTFKQLALLSKYDPGIRDLVVTGTRMYTDNHEEKAETTYFNANDTPDMPISLAIRISTSIPYFFKAIEISREDSKKYNVPVGTYVDGGVLKNLAANYYDRINPDTGKIEMNTNTLAVRIDSGKDMHTLLYQKNEFDKQYVKLPKIIGDYIQDVILHADTSKEKKIIDKDSYNRGLRTISVNNQGVDEVEFNISDEKKSKLISSANTTTSNWVHNYMGYAEHDNFAGLCNQMKLADLMILQNDLKSGAITIYQGELNPGNGLPLREVTVKNDNVSQFMKIITDTISKKRVLQHVEEILSGKNSTGTQSGLLSLIKELRSNYTEAIIYLQNKQMTETNKRPSQSVCNNLIKVCELNMKEITKLHTAISNTDDEKKILTLLKELRHLIPEHNKMLLAKLDKIEKTPQQSIAEIKAQIQSAKLETHPVDHLSASSTHKMRR